MADDESQTGSDEHRRDRRRISLLSDEPSDVDEFGGAAHNSVAASLAEMVTTEAGGRVVGLEGSWGAGKSTVVRLMRRHLTDAPHDQDATRTIVFDAWSHQNDPLRRTFLEKLIGDLREFGWLDLRHADEYTNSLTGKTSTSKSKSTTSLSAEGKVAAVSTAFVPFGLAVFEHDFGHQYELTFHVVGAVLLLLPLIALAAMGILQQLGRVLVKRDSKKPGWRGKLARLRPLRLLASSQDTTTSTDAIERGEPTSVEFEKRFSEILEEALKPPRRLVVVLDNLDRVDAAEARAILATMQTFTHSDSVSAKPWANNLWTLIPYDPAGLDRLWRASSEASSGDSQELALTSPTATAFVEKVFQVRFETPPLALSDWRTYLTKLLSEALDEEPDDIATVLHLRAVYPGVEPTGVIAQEPPTPRQLKQFVNQLGGFRRGQNDLPLAHVAYYALLRSDRLDVAARLLAGTLPYPHLVYLLGPDIVNDLAALHFGTTPATAQQLLIGRTLERALAARDVDGVRRLGERVGFSDALDGVRVDPWLDAGGVELTTAMSVLDAAGLVTADQTAQWLKTAVLPLARAQSRWILAGRESGIGLAALFDRLSDGDESVLVDLLTKVEPSPEANDPTGDLQIAGAAGLADGLTSRGRGGQTTRIVIAIPTERLVSSVAAFATQTAARESRATLEVAASTPVDLAQALLELVPASPASDVGAALDVYLSRPEQLAVSNLVTGLLARFTAQDPTTPDELLGTLIAADRARHIIAAEELLGSAADNGTLMNLIALGHAQQWPRETAAAAMLHTVVRPNVVVTQPLRQSQVGFDLVRRGMTDPATEPSLVSEQIAWCLDHKREAFGLLIKVAVQEKKYIPWVSHADFVTASR